MLHLNATDPHHADLQQPRITREEANVKALKDMMEHNWINPSANEEQDLVSLSTWKVAPHDIASDLLVGEDAYKAFRQERL